MILAAGGGTRLRPLTDTVPKPLIEIGGASLLARIARRLVAAGADRLIVNVHHHAEAIERHLAELELGVDVRISREEERALETGGGVLHAAALFRRDGPFLVHNGDVLADVDLEGLLEARRRAGALAALAVHERETSRFLLFDDEGLMGRENRATGVASLARDPRGAVRRFAFAGIHALEPRFLDRVEDRGAFSIVDAYVRLARHGERIVPVDVTGIRWFEIGTPERLAAARRALEG